MEKQVPHEHSDGKRLPVKHYKGVEGSIPGPTTRHHSLYRKQERRKRVPGWRRTHKDSIEGEWEQIFYWLVANPEWSIEDIFLELQRRSPGRYQPLQIRTLQRGMQKIGAHLLQTFGEQWQAELIHGPSPTHAHFASREGTQEPLTGG
jgi:hypothetical protein